jgi:hypothetical protein
MPSDIGHPVFLELLHDDTVKATRHSTSARRNNFFIDNGLIGFDLQI